MCRRPHLILMVVVVVGLIDTWTNPIRSVFENGNRNLPWVSTTSMSSFVVGDPYQYQYLCVVVHGRRHCRRRRQCDYPDDVGLSFQIVVNVSSKWGETRVRATDVSSSWCWSHSTLGPTDIPRPVAPYSTCAATHRTVM